MLANKLIDIFAPITALEYAELFAEYSSHLRTNFDCSSCLLYVMDREKIITFTTVWGHAYFIIANFPVRDEFIIDQYLFENEGISLSHYSS